MRHLSFIFLTVIFSNVFGLYGAQPSAPKGISFTKIDGRHWLPHVPLYAPDSPQRFGLQ